MNGKQQFRKALVVAHPGHELLLHGWLQHERPHVFVLTDGSGRWQRSRLDYTRQLLSEVGAPPGRIFGSFTDRDIYGAVLASDVDLFWNITTQLASALVAERVEFVVADAAEGYNSTHDIVRLMVGAAVEVASRSTGRPILNYEYVVKGDLTSCVAGHCRDSIQLELDDVALAAKLRAADQYTPLRAEVEAIRTGRGLKPLRQECLHRVSNRVHWKPPDAEKPYYEEYGEQAVSLGYYRDVIRYWDHVRPLGDALWEHIDRRPDAHPDHQQHAVVSGRLGAVRS